MNHPVSPADLASDVTRSAQRLARDMVARLGGGATLTERVEVERSVAGVVGWLAADGPAPPSSPRCAPLLRLALDAMAGWEPAAHAEAAAWQLALVALDLAHEADDPTKGVSSPAPVSQRDSR